MSKTGTARIRSWVCAVVAATGMQGVAAEVISGVYPGLFEPRNATQLIGAPNGTGHMLILPYYNVQISNVSIFSITNTDSTYGKFVKVRIRGAGNGDTLKSFTLMLLPGDVWNATLRQGASGVAEIMSADLSCTNPRFYDGFPEALSVSRLTNPSWSMPEKANQTREGYVEIINMADVRPGTPLFDSLRPSSGCNVPRAVLETNYDNEVPAGLAGLMSPQGGLAGKWIIMNIAQTKSYAGSMYAIRAVDDIGRDARANFVLFPETSAPYPNQISINNLTSDPLFRTLSSQGKSAAGGWSGMETGRPIAPLMSDFPDLSTPYVVPQSTTVVGSPPPSTPALDQAASITAAMLVTKISNEYATDSSIAAKSDWVVSMPSRRYSVAVDYASVASGPRPLFSMVPYLRTQYFHDQTTKQRSDNPAQLCTSISSYAFFERNGVLKNASSSGSPIKLCGAVSVISFGDPGASALGASVARDNVTVSASQNGWGSLTTRDAVSDIGLPVVGSAFLHFHNAAAAPGISAVRADSIVTSSTNRILTRS